MINEPLSGAFRVNVSDAAELSGGGFAAVWHAGLADGRDVVVKVGPAAGARLLRYERGLIAAEAAYFRTVRAGAAGVPVPEVLHLGADWIVTTLLPGDGLTGLSDSAGSATSSAPPGITPPSRRSPGPRSTGSTSTC